MYNVNGPPRGFNVTSDQSSYDLVYKDIIISSTLGTPNSDLTTYSYILGTDNINQIYKAELVSATVKFNTAINPLVVNQTLILSIPQLNYNTYSIAGNVPTGNISGISNPVYNQDYIGGTSFAPRLVNGLYNNQGTMLTQGQIFCQIPDNNTPLTPNPLVSNNIISLLIGAKMYDCTQYYNPPLNKINKIDINWFTINGDPILVNASGASGTINTFYFTLRIHYFEKRNNTSAFSTSIFNYAGTGTTDSIFKPMGS
jgi:hypothetical protein